MTEGNNEQGFGQINFKFKAPVLRGVNSVKNYAKTAVAVNDACSPAVSFDENPSSFNVCYAASNVTPNTIDSVFPFRDKYFCHSSFC